MFETDGVEKLLGYCFKDKSLISRAFTHSSISSDNNEKLEFLGDSVLGFVIAEYLYGLGQDEGEMTKRKADIVCEVNLSDAIDRLKVVSYLKAGNHLKSNITPSIKCDLCEAIIGALYLDGGIEVAKDFIFKHIDLGRKIIDFKSELQELIQQEGVNYINYKTEQIGGESHNPIFETNLLLKDKCISQATGSSKRESEQKAAEKALIILKGETL